MLPFFKEEVQNFRFVSEIFLKNLKNIDNQIEFRSTSNNLN